VKQQRQNRLELEKVEPGACCTSL